MEQLRCARDVRRHDRYYSRTRDLWSMGTAWWEVRVRWSYRSDPNSAWLKESKKNKRPYSTFNGGSFEHHTLSFLTWWELGSEYQSVLLPVRCMDLSTPPIPSEEPPLSPLISPLVSTDDYRFTALPRASTVPQSMGSFAFCTLTIHPSGRQSRARDALPYIQVHAPPGALNP